MRSLGVPEAAKAPFEEGRAGKENRQFLAKPAGIL
jgi:hypothetical protein